MVIRIPRTLAVFISAAGAILALAIIKALVISGLYPPQAQVRHSDPIIESQS